MCFRFDACFGAVPDPDDCGGGASAKGVPPRHYYHAAPVKTTTAATHRPPPPQQRNGHYHYGHQGVAHLGNGYRAPHHHHLPATADEEDRKASNDMRKGHAPATGAATTKGAVHGHAAGAAYVYSRTEDTVMQAARNAKVVAGDDEGRHGAHYYFHEREPAHREDAAADHRHSTTATTASIADHYGRY